MTISNELSDLITELQFNEKGMFDKILYMICKKIYYREKLEYADFLHIQCLSDCRQDKLLKYIKLSNSDNAYV